VIVDHLLLKFSKHIVQLKLE